MLGDRMDEEDKLTPEMEAELRGAGDDAFEKLREEGIADLAKFVRRHYMAFRKVGFDKITATILTVHSFKHFLRVNG